MPIVTINLVSKREERKLPTPIVQKLADELGQIFECAPASLWVHVAYTSRDQYAENQSELGDLAPTFVEVLLADSLSLEMRTVQAARIANLVAKLTGRPVEQTHVIFAPEARGRIAFGGQLLT